MFQGALGETQVLAGLNYIWPNNLMLFKVKCLGVLTKGWLSNHETMGVTLGYINQLAGLLALV
jgi:hypothetical protein